MIMMIPCLLRPTLAVLALLTATATAAPLAAQAPETEYDGAAALGLALRRLGATQRVLMIAAHPDDENTAVLSALALGAGADVAYLSLTRGEGGQNGIGPELQEALGIIRSEELLAARRLDGARQFFTRAYDYGFSKSADEAFRHWPADTILADAVAVIRFFRPDLIVAIFSGTPADGHGQHQAAGIIAREAFAAAGDSTRFPEQFAQGLRPHRPARLYRALWRGGGSGGYPLQTGTLDPLLGSSYHQIAIASRSRHRSQDMGRALVPGPQRVILQRVDRAEQAGTPLFAGLDTTLSVRARALGANVPPALTAILREYDDVVPTIRAAFNPLEPGALVPRLAHAAGLLERAAGLMAGFGGDPTDAGRPSTTAAGSPPTPGSANALADLHFHLAAELDDARAALTRAAGIVLDAVASRERVIPGQSVEVELTLWNGGTNLLVIERLEPSLPAGWSAAPLGDAAHSDATLAPGAIVSRRFRVSIPADAEVTEPYYLRAPRAGDIYRWPTDSASRGLPFEPPPLHARARITLAQVTSDLEREIQYRAVSSTEGESRRPVLVTPAAALTLHPAIAVLPLEAGTGRKAAAPAPRNAGAIGPSPRRGAGSAFSGEPALRFSVHLTTDALGGISGTLRLLLPPGWESAPKSATVQLNDAGERRQLDFQVTPPAGVEPGSIPVRAVFETEGGESYDRGYQVIDYHHIRARPIYREAAATIQAFDVAVASGLDVAYIPGAGDAIPDALRELGVPVTIIDPADLATTDLTPYQTVILGIRAYEHQPELPRQNRRLLEYVERGGTLIVQYNQYRFSGSDLAPYPLTIARPHDRVTDETAPVRLLDPEHPVLAWPNRITDKDFEGWVQERGLYLAHSWDERYTPLLAMSDPGEEPLRGGLLVARYGKGTYVYTGIAFFRQLPAGVPGAYRLFTNLISLGAGARP